MNYFSMKRFLLVTSEFIDIQIYQSVNASPAHKTVEEQFIFSDFLARFCFRGNRERWENNETDDGQIIKFRIR